MDTNTQADPKPVKKQSELKITKQKNSAIRISFPKGDESLYQDLIAAVGKLKAKNFSAGVRNILRAGIVSVTKAEMPAKRAPVRGPVLPPDGPLSFEPWDSERDGL